MFRSTHFSVFPLMLLLVVISQTTEGQRRGNDQRSDNPCDRPRVRPDVCCPGALAYIKPEQMIECSMSGIVNNLENIGENIENFVRNLGNGGGRGGGGGRRNRENFKEMMAGDVNRTCSFIKCMFNKFDLLKDNTTVKRDAFATYMLQQYDTDWKPAVKTTLDFCNTEIPNGGTCEPLEYIRCINKNLFLNCPSGEFSSNNRCKRLLTYITECPDADLMSPGQRG